MILQIDQPTCPVCGQKGRSVQTFTIRSLIKEQSLSAIGDDNYLFCINPDCDAVYYSASRDSVFEKDRLKVRVGLKEKASPRTLCYCFDHTIEEVNKEIRETGKSSVADDISRKIEAGLCHCEDANPEGRCCLGRVAVSVREALHGGRNEGRNVPKTAHDDCCKIR
jgi:hypothetical protein